MANCMKYLEDHDDQAKINLEELLASAYSEILQKKQVEAGMLGNRHINLAYISCLHVTSLYVAYTQVTHLDMFSLPLHCALSS